MVASSAAARVAFVYRDYLQASPRGAQRFSNNRLTAGVAEAGANAVFARLRAHG
jgi:hypothetical protein